MESKIRKSQQRAVNKYINANYDRVNLTLPKGYKDQIRQLANINGESINSYIKKAIDSRMESEKGTGN